MKVRVGKLVGMCLLGLSALLFGCKTAPPPVQPPQPMQPAEMQPVPGAKSPVKVFICNYSPPSDIAQYK